MDIYSGDIEEFYEEVAFQANIPLDHLELKRRMFAVGILNTLSLLKTEGRFIGVWKLKKVHREAIRDLRSYGVADYQST